MRLKTAVEIKLLNNFQYKGPSGAVTIPKTVKKIGYYAFGSRNDAILIYKTR